MGELNIIGKFFME